MEYKFNDWYTKKVFSEDAKELFDESCKCYKVGAFRASFLMSYLGFQVILKERILKTPKYPSEIRQDLWREITNKLMDDNTWDEEVAEAVKRKQPARIFLINDDIAEKYQYFRRVRNDCAHAKTNFISHSHVETLWLFIQANINRFIINQGRDGLVERIKIHYDPSFTKPNSNIEPIVEDIGSYMELNKISSFFGEIYEFFKTQTWYHSPFHKDDLGYDFWKAIIYSGNTDLVKALYEFIRTDWDIFFNFIDCYTQKLISILDSSDSEFTRSFWYKYFIERFNSTLSSKWGILKTIFENNIVPDDEKDALLRKVVSTKRVPPEEIIEFLRKTNYFSILKSDFFDCDINFIAPHGIDFANRNWNRIKLLLLNVELDKEIVLQLNGAFVASSYGTFNTGLTGLLLEHEKLREKYISILKENNCTIPECISEE